MERRVRQSSGQNNPCHLFVIHVIPRQNGECGPTEKSPTTGSGMGPEGPLNLSKQRNSRGLSPLEYVGVHDGGGGTQTRLEVAFLGRPRSGVLGQALPEPI